MENDAPERIRTLAEGCSRFVAQAIGIPLDGTPDTLPILDHYLALARDDDARGRDEVLGLVATSAGAYFGEVVRRAHPLARWHAPDDDPAGWRIECEHVFLAFNPVGMAREAITEEAEPGWNGHLELLEGDRVVVSDALERVGGVRDEDYHRLSIRFEVIEQAIATLEAQESSRRGGPRRFGEDVYAAVFDRPSDDAIPS